MGWEGDEGTGSHLPFLLSHLPADRVFERVQRHCCLGCRWLSPTLYSLLPWGSGCEGWYLKTPREMICIQCGLAPIPSLASSQGETGTGKRIVPSKQGEGREEILIGREAGIARLPPQQQVAQLGLSVTQPTPSLSHPPLFSKGHSRWRV